MSDEQTPPNGKMYTQSQMESIIKERIAKVAKRANEAEAQINSLTSQMDAQKNSLGTVDMLSQQLTELKDKLTKSERKYQRHTTIAKHGLSSDIVDAVEWAYDREMANLKKSDRIALEDWIDIHKSNPQTAPAILRPHLQALQPSPQEAQAEQTQTPQTPQNQAPQTPQARYPNVNANARPNIPESQDVITKAMMDPEFYKANRDKVLDAWRGQRKPLRDS